MSAQKIQQEELRRQGDLKSYNKSDAERVEKEKLELLKLEDEEANVKVAAIKKEEETKLKAISNKREIIHSASKIHQARMTDVTNQLNFSYQRQNNALTMETDSSMQLIDLEEASDYVGGVPSGDSAADDEVVGGDSSPLALRQPQGDFQQQGDTIMQQQTKQVLEHQPKSAPLANPNRRSILSRIPLFGSFFGNDEAEDQQAIQSSDVAYAAENNSEEDDYKLSSPSPDEESVPADSGDDESITDEFVAALVEGFNTVNHNQELAKYVGEATELCKDLLEHETHQDGVLKSKLKTNTINNIVLKAAVSAGFLESTKASNSYRYKLGEDALIILEELESE
jgi:hypothetical protein